MPKLTLFLTSLSPSKLILMVPELFPEFEFTSYEEGIKKVYDKIS